MHLKPDDAASKRHPGLTFRQAHGRLFERVRRQPEFLDALSGIDLRGIDVTLGIDGDFVKEHELPGVTANTAEAPDFSCDDNGAGR